MYQGWANWATWNVALWVGNDEPVYRQMRALLPYTPQKAKLFCERIYPNGTPDMRMKMIGERKIAWDGIDWAEIAANFNEES